MLQCVRGGKHHTGWRMLFDVIACRCVPFPQHYVWVFSLYDYNPCVYLVVVVHSHIRLQDSSR